jgi:hypothetical protein
VVWYCGWSGRPRRHRRISHPLCRDPARICLACSICLPLNHKSKPNPGLLSTSSDAVKVNPCTTGCLLYMYSILFSEATVQISHDILGHARSVIDVGFLLPCPPAGSVLGQADAASSISQFARFSRRQIGSVRSCLGRPVRIIRYSRRKGTQKNLYNDKSCRSFGH